jgi:hypothetical protein
MNIGHHPAFRASFCVVVLFVCVSTFGQVPDRTSIVINEISPVSEGGGVPWIEFFNPQDVPVQLAGLRVRNGGGEEGGEEREEIFVPDNLDDLPESLPPRGYLLIWFDDERPAGTVKPGAFGRKTELWVPADRADTWIPAHGELSLFETVGHAPPKLIDYVAWGGSENPRAVPLAEGFGVVDPTASLDAIGSIGLYPVESGTPEHWVIYNGPTGCVLGSDHRPCEVTPGLPNAIPRPKTFTPPSGSTLGANTVAFGWARNPLDEGYRVEMARDPGFSEVMFSLPVQSANVRMGWTLEPGPAYFRVYAMSDDIWSKPSEPFSLTIEDSKCGALPIWAFSYPDIGLIPSSTWCSDPAPEECEVLESIEFKYQRKDSRLFCPECPAGRRDRPHRLCMTVVLRQSEWDSTWPGDSASYLSWPWCLLADNRISRSCRRGGPQWLDWFRKEEHGVQYCVPASISMIASAYGKCLSQDRIAFYLHSNPNDSDYTPAEDLGHDSRSYCSDEDHCPGALKWALGLPPEPSEMLFQALDASAVDFSQIKTWIEGHRPIMVARPGHASVIAGYCVDETTTEAQEEWLFVYDPVTGPILAKATAITEIAKGFWATPPVENVDCFDRAQARASKNVRGDEGGVWNDWDQDGIVDFDEALRFGTSPFCKVTNPDLLSDWAWLQLSAAASSFPPIVWTPWDPWMVCPWPE